MKLHRLSREALDLQKIITLVGRDAQLTMGLECSMNVCQKTFRHKAAARMPALGPGIRKHEMKDQHGAGRQQSTDRMGSFQVQNARVTQPGTRDSPASCRHSSGQAFDPEKVLLGVKRGDLDQERAVTASKIDFELSLSGKNLLEIERGKIICRKNFGARALVINSKRKRWRHA